MNCTKKSIICPAWLSGLLLGTMMWAGIGARAEAPAVALRCEYQTAPLGIDTKTPHLSWRMESDVMGLKQTAYRILVASSQEKLARDQGDLWDSGKVMSDQSQHIRYAGATLTSRMACYWKVQVWTACHSFGGGGDKEGKPAPWSESSRWTMGLLRPEDWTCAWIEAPSEKPEKREARERVIVKATYRTLDGAVEKDVTDVVRELLGKTKEIRVDEKTLRGDPARNKVKELVIEYTEEGVSKTARGTDKKTVTLDGETSTGAQPTIQFRKDFKLEGVPSSAYVTVHSPSYFELHVNGKKAGTDVLSPAVSNLRQTTFSLTYDVKDLLRPGNNTLGLWLGKGWSSSIVVRAQLDAVVEGKLFTLVTDPSWKARTPGRYHIGGWKWGDFGGERVDAREAMADWCRPEQDASAWKNALAATPKLGPVQTQPCPPTRLGEPIQPVSVTDIGKGLYEIDFGRALTGWLRMEMPQLVPGTEVTLEFADTKSELCKRGAKIGEKDSYQTFRQVSKFVASGQPGELFEHKFNFASFRYVIVGGLSAPPAKERTQAMLVDSALEIVGSFECSNPLLNKIHEVNAWTQRSLNLGGYYVDCPHRERMGYGDGQVAAEGFMANFRADGFYRKWLADWRSVQGEDGGIKNSAPFGAGGGGPGWGGTLSALTWRHFLYYGDRRVLEENYDAVKRYVDNLEQISRNNNDILTGKTSKYSFIGDWVAPGRGMDSSEQPTPRMRELFNNGYRVHQMNLLVSMAKVLGKDADTAAYAQRIEEVRPKIHEAFYAVDAGNYVIDEQAYYVMPLMAGIVPEALRTKVFQNLEKNILKKNNGHLDTGMLGTYFLMEYLRETGRSDLVFTMFNQKSYPGWGYMIENGATTFWEQWNGYWSQVHSCFTSADNWLYQGLGGIQADPSAPGFKKFIIKPDPVGDVSWVKAHYDSPYGRISSHWKREGETFTLKVAVPPNSTGVLYLPAASQSTVLVNGKSVDKNGFVRIMKQEEGRVVFHVDSGTYTFTAKMDQ